MILFTRLFQQTLSHTLLVATVLTGLWLVLLPLPAHAGCGCDKAPPAPAQIRPHATYAGMAVTIFGAALQANTAYDVTFTSGITGASITVDATAVWQRDLADSQYKAQLVVPLPALPLGPTSVQVSSAGQDNALFFVDDTALTVVPQPVALPNETGGMVLPDFQAAVSRDSVVYVALDLTGITMPRTYQATAVGYPLRFSNVDVIFYNTQGFVMQLLAEGMPGLYTVEAGSGNESDVLQYSRHEFNTYFLQHTEQQVHDVDPSDANWHLDGTPHIDHDHLIVAIAGDLADGAVPAPGATPPFDLTLTAASFFTHGLVGDTSVDVRGGSHVNSYDTQTGSFGTQGDVRSNGPLLVGQFSLIEGNATATSFDISNNSSVTGALIPATSPVAFLPVELPAHLEDLGAIVLTDGMTQTLGPGSYRVDQVNVTGWGSQLFIDNTTGPVTLYATGHVTNGGTLRAVKVGNSGRIVVADPDPEKFAIYVAEGVVRVRNDGVFAGVIYAPHSSITIRDGTFVGSFVGSEVIVVDDATVSYDIALRGQSGAPGSGSETPDGTTASDGMDTQQTTSSSDGIDGTESTSTESTTPSADVVSLTKAVYNNQKSKVIVHATSDRGPDALLTVSIDGFVSDAPMTYNAKKGRYQYTVKTNSNLDGHLVTIVSDFGGMTTGTLQ